LRELIVMRTEDEEEAERKTVRELLSSCRSQRAADEPRRPGPGASKTTRALKKREALPMGVKRRL
jgi:hypothetical protein